MTRSIFEDSGFVLSESLSAVRLSENVPATEPVFLRSTAPVEVSPGFQLLEVRIAAASLELDMVSVPAVNVLLGFALEAEELAPQPPATPTATRTRASTLSVRFGC